jgi:hypothetical protein
MTSHSHLASARCNTGRVCSAAVLTAFELETVETVVIYLTNHGIRAKFTTWKQRRHLKRFSKQSFTSQILITVCGT